MVLDVALLDTQHYKARIKGKMEQSREWISAPLHFGVVTIEKGAFGSPSTKIANFAWLLLELCGFKGSHLIQIISILLQLC